jgi:hypothetical protein
MAQLFSVEWLKMSLVLTDEAETKYQKYLKKRYGTENNQ